jgi:signal transduction histidine kinase
LRPHCALTSESTCAKANLKLDGAVDEAVGPVPKDVAIALFRLVQEGMTNITRHAAAQQRAP